MLDQIQQIKETSSFDFRIYTFPDDPLKYLFNEWVDYYKSKFAICRAINPSSILEIGVRFGYSAIAFLSACPHARYLGIDNDSDTYGGSVGALEWARKNTSSFTAEFLVADTQRMETLPGDFYDLVHIDGQQDGDGTFHDMELALEKARWILIDGFFWSRQNMLSATFFLEKYRRFLKGAYIIPGYAGDLLVETKTTKVRKIFRAFLFDHSDLRDTYDDDYFLFDCGGYSGFKAFEGRRLTDQRLVALLHLASPCQEKSILDIGSGRGEFAFACYQSGASVVAVDYSKSAIDIATSTFKEHCGGRLSFVHKDILDFETDQCFDVITAADFVEHVLPDILEKVLSKVKSLLKPSGRFLVHTWPNRLAYEYQHRWKRGVILRAGSYLPRNPRTYYEDLMHINEQTPARLRKALANVFPHVLVWVGSAHCPLGSLQESSLVRSVKTFDSIYAVASDLPIVPDEIIASLSQTRLPLQELNGVVLVEASLPAEMRPGKQCDANITIRNGSGRRLCSCPPFPVHCSYHWYQDGNMVIRDGLRAGLIPTLTPGEQRAITLPVRAPNEAGDYEIAVTLVQDQCFWFDDLLPSCVVRRKVKVR